MGKIKPSIAGVKRLTDFDTEDTPEYLFPTIIIENFLMHRSCIACGSGTITKLIKEDNTRIYCKECDAEQPEEQLKITEKTWEKIVDKGAPPFYKRSAEDILDEMEKDGIGILQYLGNMMPIHTKVTCLTT